MNSNQPNIHVDASRFYEFVESMDKKTMDKAEKEALRNSVRVVTNQTRRNMRSRFPGAFSTKGGRRISEGLVTNVKKSTDNRWYGQVHIMGNQKSQSRGYILKFFEMGTDERFSKVRARAYHGRTTAELSMSGAGYRGRIKGLWFFRDAVAATQQQVFNGIDDRMQAAVGKQWAKAAAKGGQL